MTNPNRGGLVVLGGLLTSLMLGASVVSPSPATAVTVAPSSIHASQEASAALGTDAAEPDAAEPVPGTEITIDDPGRAQDAAVELSGEVVVSVSETLSVDAHSEPTVYTSYAVETAAGQVVPVTGEFPDSVSTGDQFTGTVAVDAVVKQLAPETALELESSTQGSGALPEAAEATQEAIAAADESGTELPVVQAQVTVAAAATTAAGQAHEIVIVANAPTGLSRPIQTDAQLRTLAEQAGAHWRTSSNGQISRFSVAPQVTQLTGGSCGEDPFTTWNRAAQKLGYSSWSTFRTSTPGTSRHLVVLNPAQCAETGVGVVGSGIHYGGAVRQSLGKGVDLSTLTHEIGHNLGLGHSDLHVCTSGSCSKHEYWDIYDVMGLGVQGYDTLTPLNTSTASRLGFLPASASTALALPAGTATKTWTIDLAPLRSASGIRHVAATDPQTGELFHIELRSGQGTPTPYYASAQRSLSGKTVSFTPGVRMLRAVSNGSAAVTSAQPGGVHLPAVRAGQSLSSPSGGIKVTAVSGSPTTSMRVQVTLGSSTASTASPDGSFPVYRFWSDAYQGHFYTISAAEKAHVQANYPSHIWRYEAVAYRAFTSKKPGTIPLYRFWSNTMNGHFYTASEAEKNHVIAAYDDNVWKYETIAYYVYPTSSATSATMPVYRFWSDTQRHHFYTASAAERDHVIRSYDDRVWKYETAAYRVPSS
ncbi:hypothetical protein FVA74_06360 [Salinibacterium sp. dk2585]|uniref:hypothetical protein n=1 Tax=unclassified Salinibacterium TaxID=2632331 RepID=UPI0011C24466|nr:MULTISPECIES: hypothetical protein [unclassified Salinibacterium]QEE61241.1 hypothetical protein FVA74_06360 [Salinibacterium sp. dk2585]TXK53917.1 hypothetical protein FVP63_07810 [Salinibacterium sp. dk5596]